MKFRKLRSALFRIMLEQNDFYEDVIFENKTTRENAKKFVTEWMTSLQIYKQIRIRRFKDLFSQLEELVFPITIKNCYSYSVLYIDILDDEGKEYYMIKNSFYDYHNLEKYVIGRRDSLLEPLVDRDFEYKIDENAQVTLEKSGVMKLKQDGTNDNTVVEFYYDHENQKTVAELKLFENTNKIKVIYPKSGDEYDKMISTILFRISRNKECYYDVFAVLEWVAVILKDSISIIAEEEGQVSSEILVVNGIVEKYTITQIVNEEEKLRIEKKTKISLNEFLTKKQQSKF